MLMLDRHYDAVFFESGEGGAPLLWQHLSWMFFTGAYFATLVTAFGAIAEILPVFAGRRAPSHRAQAGALVAIAVIGPLAWMQNMLAAPLSVGLLYSAMLMATLICVPVAVLLFNWITTIWGGSLHMRAPLLFALGAISTITIGLALELVQTVIPVAWQLGNTAFATAATHYALVGGAIFGGFAALHYWFPKMTGRTMLEGPARLSFWLLLIGVHASFVPLLLAGLRGQPVDIYKYFGSADVGTYNLIATVGTVVLAAGIVVTLANAVSSMRAGGSAGHDPWGGRTLEWFALSPPAESNFDLAPDVRSAEPLIDIRRAIERRTGAGEDAAEAEKTEAGSSVA
jgi:cytochrome c oxidase subunit 1